MTYRLIGAVTATCAAGAAAITGMMSLGEAIALGILLGVMWRMKP